VKSYLSRELRNNAPPACRPEQIRSQNLAADAALVAEAIARFSVVQTVMMRRNV